MNPFTVLNRRAFLTGLCGSPLLCQAAAAAPDEFDLLGPSYQKPIDAKIRIQPICSERVHAEAYNGPCRWQPLEQLTMEAERRQLADACGRLGEGLRSLSRHNATLLPPETVEYGEGDIIPETFWKKMEAAIGGVDLFVTTYRVPGLERFRKPVAMVGTGVVNVDVAAYYRSLGVEAFAAYDWEDLDRLISLLKVRKAMRETRLLLVTSRPSQVPYGVYSSIVDFEALREKYGIETQAVSLPEFLGAMESAARTPETREAVRRASDRFVRGAVKLHMKPDTIARDMEFYAPANALLRQYRANAFTVACDELCASRAPWRLKFTPCSTISLLRDQGIPAACEGDVSALVATAALMYLSRKSCYMGNPKFDREENLVRINHDAPSLRMKGLDGPELPYEIVNFTDTGFGATVRYDFGRDNGQPVTLCRFGPKGDAVLAASGRIQEAINLLLCGCRLGVAVKVHDALDLFRRSEEVGHHLAMVYGDYTEDIRRLSRIMGFRLV